MTYSSITIIYNPFSTGQAQTKAQRLADRLGKRKLKVTLEATQHSGHAEALAYQLASQQPHPLIISASGDGGYNEVVNGVMRAKAEHPQHRPVCAILPAGNANDHRRSVRKHPLTWAITRTQPEAMDLLELEIRKGNFRQLRYAHSYIGLGISSHAAAQLNQETLNPIKEKLIVAKAIFAFRPLAITHGDGKTKRYDSLVFFNIHQMSKVLRAGSKADINNGSFRVAAIPHRSQFFLARILLNILLFMFGLVKLPQQSSYQFGVPQTELIHLDGEVISLPAQSEVTVRIKPAALLAIR